MPEVTLITPTSDRPIAFALCQRWMQRAIAVYGQPVEWIVADDGSSPALCTLGQLHLRRPKAADRKASFLGNLQWGLRAATGTKILFIEDDDWYTPRYIAEMARRLEGVDITGEARARYYNLHTQTYRVMANSKHASLCQTGIRRELVPIITDRIQRHFRTAVDMDLWRISTDLFRCGLVPQSTMVVGMKGLPGTPGLGLGHRMVHGVQSDESGTVLAQWTSKEDALAYQNLPRI